MGYLKIIMKWGHISTCQTFVWTQTIKLGHLVTIKVLKSLESSLLTWFHPNTLYTSIEKYYLHLFLFQRLEDPVEHCAWGLWTHGKTPSCFLFAYFHHRSALSFSNLSFCLTQEPPKEDLTVSEKFQLVLDVAQKAQVQHRIMFIIKSVCNSKSILGVHVLLQLSLQNLFGKMADVLEKIKKYV